MQAYRARSLAAIQRRAIIRQLCLRGLVLLGMIALGTVAGYVTAIIFAPAEPDPPIHVKGDDISSYDFSWTGISYKPKKLMIEAAMPPGEKFWRNFEINSFGEWVLVSYDTASGDSPTRWSYRYLFNMPLVSMTIYHCPHGGTLSLTLIARDSKPEFHDYDVIMRNLYRFIDFLKLSLPIGMMVFGIAACVLLAFLDIRPSRGASAPAAVNRANPDAAVKR